MHNQDDVARLLTRCSIGEMHRLMIEFGLRSENRFVPWENLYYLSTTKEFLLLHGWTVSEYSKFSSSS